MFTWIPTEELRRTKMQRTVGAIKGGGGRDKEVGVCEKEFE